MRTQYKFVVLIGVALSVTPIFSSVSAQQSGSRADLFLEMQDLRSEIAQLRDMVERQQHQMKKLQRSLDQQGGQSQSVPGQQPYQNNPAQGSQGYQTVPSATIDSSAGQYTENSVGRASLPISSGQATLPTGSTIRPAGSSVSYSGSTVNSAEALPNDVSQNGVSLNDAYRPSSSASVIEQSGDLSPSQYPVSNTTPVEERVIGAPKLPSSGTTYPPVIERSIGGAENSSNAQSSVRDAGFAGANRVSQYPIDASASPQAPQSVDNNLGLNPDIVVSSIPQAVLGSGGSGVIAIPNSSVSDPNYPPVGSSQPAANAGSDQQTGSVQPGLADAATTGLSEQDYYQRGFGLLKESKHSQAVNIFKQQISSYPQGSYADDAHYWIAESMYVNRALDDSKQYFRAIIDNYPQSPRLPDAMLKTAYIEQEQGNVIEARILLQEIIQYHPRSNAAISAKNRLPELK